MFIAICTFDSCLYLDISNLSKRFYFTSYSMVNYLVGLFLCVSLQKTWRCHLDRDRMVVGCTTICAISVYHN